MDAAKPNMTSVIAGDGSALSQELNQLRKTLFPPEVKKGFEELFVR